MPDDRAVRPEGMLIRRAEAGDLDAVLGLFDDAVAWFVSVGNTEQWGVELWSAQERRVAQLREACALPEAWVAELPGAGAIGLLVLGDAMPYVSPAESPEVYVRILIGSRDARARGAGRALLAFADAEAERAGVDRLRVDCYAGGSGALVRFTESCGYARTEEFAVEGWPGQVLERRLGSAA